MALFFSSLYVDLVILLVAAFASLYWFLTRKFDFWKQLRVPYIEPQIIFGNLKDSFLLRKSTTLMFQDLYNKLKEHSYGGIFQGREPALIVRDPDIIKHITVKDFSHFQDRGVSIDFKTNPLSQHLFVLEGSKWNYFRTKLSPAFASGKMKNMFKIMEECSKCLQEYLAEPASKGEVLELKEVLAKFAADQVGIYAFGLHMHALEYPNSEFIEVERKLSNNMLRNGLKRLLVTLFPQIGNTLGIRIMDSKSRNFFLKVAKETVQHREQTNIQRNDFLQLLMQLKKQGKVDDDENVKGEQDDVNIYKNVSKKQEEEHFKVDDTVLAAHVLAFLIAGYETSSTAMSFALHELAVNPDLQEKLRAEIDAALEASGGNFSYDAVMGMQFLDKVISESLRKYPPVGVLLRRVTIPYTIPGSDVRLPSGTKVLIPVYALHHDPQYFPQPQRFDPERFSEAAKAARPRCAYLPFGEGPRRCIAIRFALLQIKMGLVALLHKYEFHVCERTEVPVRLDPRAVVTTSATGIVLRVTRRQQCTRTHTPACKKVE